MASCALVTGAAKRIGRAIALALAARGYDIALHYNRSAQPAEQLARDIRGEHGVRCVTFRADLSDEQQVSGLTPRVFHELPHCDLLVNNASIFERGSFIETEEALFDRTMQVNFKAPFFLARDFARQRGCEGGHIINLLDTKITRDADGYFAYTLSKKMLAEFTSMAAVDLAPGMRVNGICPGPILPPPGQDQGELEKLAPLVPLKRVGDPTLIVRAVIYLIENDFVTGEQLYVDGGQHLH